MSSDDLPQFMILKNTGNDQFQKKDYLKSIQYYTQSIHLNPCYLQAYSNRAISYYQLKEYSLSLQDSQLILRDNPLYIKSIVRKALCLIQLLHIDEGLNLFHQAQQLQRLKKYSPSIENTKKLQLQQQGFLKQHKKQNYKLASQHIKNLHTQIPDNDELKFYHVDCCIHLYNKQTIQSFFKDMIDSRYQHNFLYWYLKAKFDLMHCNKSKAKRYIDESLRYISRLNNNNRMNDDGGGGEIIKISKIMTYYKEQAVILSKNMQILQRYQNDRQLFYKYKKYKECIGKCNVIFKFNFLSLKDRIATYEKRSLCYRQFKEYPRRYQDIITILKLEINSPTGLELRYEFFMDDKKFIEAKHDITRLKQFQPERFKKIEREIDTKSFRNRIKYKTYYDVLGVEPFCSTKQIIKSYKQLAVIYHPDKNVTFYPEVIIFASDRWSDIQRVYDVLHDPQKRKVYDRTGREEQEIIDEKIQEMREQFMALFRTKTIKLPGLEMFSIENMQKRIDYQQTLSRMSEKDRKRYLKMKRQEEKQKQKQKLKQKQLQRLKNMSTSTVSLIQKPNQNPVERPIQKPIPYSQQFQQDYTQAMNELNQNIKKGNIAQYAHLFPLFRANPLLAQRMASLPVFNNLKARSRMPYASSSRINFMGLQ